MNAPTKVSIIVPVYNEAQTIESVVDRILAVDLGGIEREVLIVNDGSDDATRSNIDGSRWRGTSLRIRASGAHPKEVASQCEFE